MHLQNKVVCFLGDSITEGVGVEDRENNRYDNRLKKEYQLKMVYNYGISGTRLAHQNFPSEKPRYDLCFAGRSCDLEKSADIVVVYGGVNDYIHGDAPVGTLQDTTPATFCGGVDFLMRNLKECHPTAQVVFLTPAHCCFEDLVDEKPSPRPNKKADAKPLEWYVRVIEQKGKEYGIPVLNLFETLGINPNCQADRETYTVDGLHFNDLGHAVLAKRIGAFLEAL